MDTRKNIDDLTKRWNIVENTNRSEEFSKFKQRILNSLANIDDLVERDGIIQFCNYIPIKVKWEWNSQAEYSLNIINTLTNEVDENIFYRMLNYLFFLPFKRPNVYMDTGITKEILYEQIKEIIDISNVNVAIAKHGEMVKLYPSGEKYLDEKLVSIVFTYLNKESNKHFIDALDFYMNKKYIKSAESLRRTLEEFLRFKLKNEKGLDNNIAELQSRLKIDGRDIEIRKILFQTFNCLDKYFNENSKHKDGDIDETENEFLIYQTGVLMRYINKVIMS